MSTRHDKTPISEQELEDRGWREPGEGRFLCLFANLYCRAAAPDLETLAQGAYLSICQEDLYDLCVLERVVPREEAAA